MKTFEKIYIGKGKKVGDMNIVKVTLKLDDLLALAYEYEGTQYVSFEIAQMINPDTFGRTHTVYHSKLVSQPGNEPVAEKPKTKRGRKASIEA